MTSLHNYINGHIHNQGTPFGHRTQRFCFCYFSNIKSKWKILTMENKLMVINDDSNYDHFHGGDDFSHMYIIMHNILVQNPKM